MIQKTLTIIFVFTSFYSVAQNIKGVVLDEKTNEFLVGAHVYIKNINMGVATDKKGEFVLKVESKISINDTLFISLIGYVTEKIS